MGYHDPERLRKDHSLGGFDCGVEELNVWLARYAIQADAAGSANVFVTTSDRCTVVGFYAIAAGAVKREQATKRVAKGQPNHPIPVILLARLAVDQSHQGAGLGQSLLKDAIIRADAATDKIAARALIVHAKDNHAKDWYLKHGFEPSPTDPLHLQILFKDLRKQTD